MSDAGAEPKVVAASDIEADREALDASIAEFAGEIYTEGESFRHLPNGSIQFLFGPPAPGDEGILDFFFRVNLQAPQLASDVNGDGVCDAFDVLAYLELYNAEDALADINSDGFLDDLDITDFLALLDGPCP